MNPKKKYKIANFKYSVLLIIIRQINKEFQCSEELPSPFQIVVF